MTSQIKVDQIKGAAGDVITIPSGTTLNCAGTASGTWGGGNCLQVKHAIKVGIQSASANGTNVDITDLSISITPASASNKIYVGFDVSGEGNDSCFHLARNGTKISVPTTSSGSRTLSHSGGCNRNTYDNNASSMAILDNPATTSAVTYNVEWSNTGSSGTNYVNRTGNDADNLNGERLISSIYAWEIASAGL